MKKAISLFLVCVVLLLSMSGCSIKAEKDSLAACVGLTSSSQIESVMLCEGYHRDEWTLRERVDDPPQRRWIDLTGTAEGNKYIEALFSDAAAETEEPVAVAGPGYPLNGSVVYLFKEDDTLDYTKMGVNIYRDETPYTATVILTYTDDKRWEIMQEDNYAKSDYPKSENRAYLFPETQEVWSREYIDNIFAEKAE